METIAVYWEKNIKTYGFRVEKNLCMVQADILSDRLAALGSRVADLGRQKMTARLLLAHPNPVGSLRCYLVFDNGWKDELDIFFAQPVLEDLCGNIQLDSPVEMLRFHGPHFGDRYGIADMACSALKKDNIRYTVMGCSAASVHIIFPEKMTARAEKALGAVFKTP